MDEMKRRAALEAVKLVSTGMVVGLGTGSTAAFAIEALEDKDITGVPTSKATEMLCRNFGIRTVSPNEINHIDIAIDGADQVDPSFNLIKGAGGALTREKIVASMAERFVVVVDRSKLVKKLSGQLPVEVLPFGWTEAKHRLQALGAEVRQRDFITDNGNFILDCRFDEIDVSLGPKILDIPSVVEHGIFPHEMVSQVIVGRKGSVKIYDVGKKA